MLAVRPYFLWVLPQPTQVCLTLQLINLSFSSAHTGACFVSMFSKKGASLLQMRKLNTTCVFRILWLHCIKSVPTSSSSSCTIYQLPEDQHIICAVGPDLQLGPENPSVSTLHWHNFNPASLTSSRSGHKAQTWNMNSYLWEVHRYLKREIDFNLLVILTMMPVIFLLNIQVSYQMNGTFRNHRMYIIIRLTSAVRWPPQLSKLDKWKNDHQFYI